MDILNQNGDIAIRFRMQWLRIKVNSLILTILTTIKLVATASPLCDGKKGSTWQCAIKYLPHGENLVKIGPVDPEIIFTQIYIF